MYMYLCICSSLTLSFTRAYPPSSLIPHLTAATRNLIFIYLTGSYEAYRTYLLLCGPAHRDTQNAAQVLQKVRGNKSTSSGSSTNTNTSSSSSSNSGAVGDVNMVTGGVPPLTRSHTPKTPSTATPTPGDTYISSRELTQRIGTLKWGALDSSTPEYHVSAFVKHLVKDGEHCALSHAKVRVCVCVCVCVCV